MLGWMKKSKIVLNQMKIKHGLGKPIPPLTPEEVFEQARKRYGTAERFMDAVRSPENKRIAQ